jgi:hypothetical protein
MLAKTEAVESGGSVCPGFVGLNKGGSAISLCGIARGTAEAGVR